MEYSIDPVWEEIHSSREWGAYPSEFVIRFVARNFYGVEDRSKVRLLDFGCGQGANAWYFAREGFDTYAFDGSESAISKAKKRFQKDGLEASFKVCNGTDANYDDMFFDAVVDNVCIYANPIGAIREMYKNVYRMLKPNGKLITICFGEELDGYKSGEEVEPHTYKNIKEGNLKNGGIQHIFTRKEIVDLLAETGFKNISCEMGKYTDNGYMVHHYICIAEKGDI